MTFIKRGVTPISGNTASVITTAIPNTVVVFPSPESLYGHDFSETKSPSAAISDRREAHTIFMEVSAFLCYTIVKRAREPLRLPAYHFTLARRKHKMWDDKYEKI